MITPTTLIVVSTLALINIVGHQARLLLGWVTACGRYAIRICKQPPRLTLNFCPPWNGKMSISFRAE